MGEAHVHLPAYTKGADRELVGCTGRPRAPPPIARPTAQSAHLQSQVRSSVMPYDFCGDTSLRQCRDLHAPGQQRLLLRHAPGDTAPRREWHLRPGLPGSATSTHLRTPHQLDVLDHTRRGCTAGGCGPPDTRGAPGETGASGLADEFRHAGGIQQIRKMNKPSLAITARHCLLVFLQKKFSLRATWDQPLGRRSPGGSVAGGADLTFTA